MDFTLSVTVTGPAKRPDPWLLVVQCSSEPGQPKQPSATLWSESAAGSQPVGSVLATSQTKARWTGTFACYTGLSGHGQTASAVIKGQDINLSLPTLEQNLGGQSSLAAAPLYAESASPASNVIKNLVAVQGIPGLPCPTTSPSPSVSPTGTPPTASSSATPSASASAPSTPPASDSASATPPASDSAPASPTASSPGPGTCYKPVLRRADVTKYSFPTTVVTTEILENVNLADERIDSMFPPGQIGTSTVTWPGTSGLSPSISATNLASAERQNKDAFWAGLLYGITAALAVPFLQCVPEAWRAVREAGEEAKNALERVAEEHRESTAGPGTPAPEDSSARGREEGSG